VLTLVAMLVCSFFGGAVSDPQYRYQGRLIWLVPFFAAIAFCLWRRALASKRSVSGTEAAPASATRISAAAS